jgi:hypothetical protein
LNRTAFRSNDIEGADADFLFWLRNSPKKYKAVESEASKNLREEFGMTRVYSSDLFYRHHKIS